MNEDDRVADTGDADGEPEELPGVTAEYVCPRCDRGQCARCRDTDCACCAGNQEDGQWPR